MAYGIIRVMPASTHVDIPLSGSGGGTSYPSVKVLNPNDGVLYLARNRDCLSTAYGDWDWKVPSQSYAMLPGPFSSVGVFYLDQSGAGHQGEFTIYPSQQKLDEPLFLAIGRALLAQATSLDITEGAQPANPGAGILRLWASGTDVLHALNGGNVDHPVFFTDTALGVALVGTLPSPSLNAVGGAPAASTTLTVAGTYFDLGIQFALAAGTYLCLAYIVLQQGAAGAGLMRFRIANLAETIEVGRVIANVAASQFATMAISKVAILSADTYRIEAESDAVANATANGGVTGGLAFVRIS